MSITLEGTYTALVTPFVDDGDRAIDWAAFDALVEAQIAGGVSGLVPCGTTGESPAFSHEEHLAVIARTVKVARGRTQVIAGTGSGSTKHAVELSRAAEKAGANGVMVVVPYYNRPTQAGLVAHFVEIAKSVSCPLVIYNVPARTGSDLAAESLAKIAEAAPNAIATKEATGNVLRAQQIANLLGARMTVLSGDDALTLPMIAVGAKGVISVTSNLYPAEVSRATKLALQGNMEEARRAHLALLPIHEAMFVEANPSPVKAALAHKKKMSAAVRMPLVRATDAAKSKIVQAMDTFEASQR